MGADEVHYLRDRLAFTNPFMHFVNSDYMYPFVLAVWRSAEPPCTTPPWLPLSLERAPPSDAAQRLRLRRCTVCGKHRMLPRYQAEPAAPFICASLADPRYARCEAPCPVWQW